jgi:predicted nucleotidyltransferase
MAELDPDDDSAIIERAGQALIEAVAAPAKVMLFGSHARGEADDRSAFDFLVIERDVDDGFGETARLNTLLGHMLILPRWSWPVRTKSGGGGPSRAR